MDINKATKLYCLDNDITLTKLAETMGINQKSLYSALSSSNPTLKSICKISEALGIKASELIATAEEY